MRRAVITGVTGFIGRALAQRLLSAGVEVLGLGRNEKVIKDLKKRPNFHFIRMEDCRLSLGDITYENAVFFHLAWEGVSGNQKGNCYTQIKNIENAYDAFLRAKELGCNRFVFAGSVDEYEAVHKPDEQFQQPTHSWMYGSGKFASENFLKMLAFENDIEYVGALMVLSYGEGNATGILPNMMIRKAFSDKTIALVEGNHYYDMLYIEDTINALINLAEKGTAGESYYVGHRKIETFRKVVSDINDILELDLKLGFGKYQEKGSPLNYSAIDREKMFRDTGFECDYNFEKGLKNTYKWLTNGYL